VEIDFAPFLSILIACEENVPSDYEFLGKEIRNLISSASQGLDHGDLIDINLGVIGSFTFPFFRYRTLTSLDLFSPEDLFLFSRYYRHYPKINNFIDVGMNIGLHSIVARNIGYSVVGFEPDLETFTLSKKFFYENNIEFVELDDKVVFGNHVKKPGELLLAQAAVSDFNGYTKFTKVLDNPTANHLSGRKMNVYGDLHEQTVRVVSIDQLNFEAVIKIDAEGEDVKILKSLLNSENISGMIYLCDWRIETRQDIFDLLSKNSSSCYNPFSGKQLENIDDLPLCKSCDFIEVKVS